MKSLQKKQEFIIQKILPIFQIQPNTKHTLGITQDNVNQINALLPDIKKVFVMREFNLHKTENKLLTPKQTRSFLLKCLKQAQLEYEMDSNSIRLIWKKDISYSNMNETMEIRTLSLDEFEDVKTVTQFVCCKGKSFVHFPNFICNPEYTLLSAQITENVSDIQYELQITGNKVKEGLVNPNTELLLNTIFPCNIDIYQMLTIVLFSLETVILPVKLIIGKLKTPLRREFEKGEHLFVDAGNNLNLRLLDGKVKVSYIQICETVVTSPVVQYKIHKSEILVNKKIIHIASSKYNQFPSLTSSDFIIAMVQDKADIVLGFTNINYDGIISTYKSELFQLFEQNGIYYAVHTINRCCDIIRQIKSTHPFKLYCNNQTIIYSSDTCLNVVNPYFSYSLVLEFKDKKDIEYLSEKISIELEYGIVETELRKKLAHLSEPLTTLEKIVEL